MKKPVVRKLRRAIYTRKSTEEGLDMEFNSLDAQREACGSYIASQRAEGWVELADRYGDGGVSGATLDRPALKRLLADIEHGRVDVVVVYKIDRLSRALMDFAKLVEVFDRNNVTFVSVTQSFNTTTSMGRLTLNILLSFAQFEREVIGERIRDKVAASRKRGMWMGGFVPMGYRVENRKLAVHKGTAYPGEHQAIIDQALWDKVHGILQESPRTRACRTRADTPALLKGLLFGPTGRAMSPTHTRRAGGRLSRYYVSQTVLQGGVEDCPMRRVPAAQIEAAVVNQLRALLRSPEVIVATWRAARPEIEGLSEHTVREALERLDPLWEELFPAEQARIVQLLVARVDVTTDGLQLHLRVQGLGQIVGELGGVGLKVAA